MFEEHIGRLKENVAEVKAQGQTVPTHLTQQLIYCDSVSRALLDREEAVKLNRAYILFNIDVPSFGGREKATVEADVKELRARGKAIFDTLSTQAFQLGYLMAVLSHVEILLPAAATYDDRLATTDFVSTLYLTGLNTFFAVPTAPPQDIERVMLQNPVPVLLRPANPASVACSPPQMCENSTRSSGNSSVI